MRCEFLVVSGVIWFLLTGAIQGQSAFAIRAAATSPVVGWQQMTSADRAQVLWVAPTNNLTSVDIERAEPSTSSDGYPAVAFVFTDEGAKKMAELSGTRRGQPIAFLLDGRLIWAPVVRAGIEKEAVLSGGPGGLRPDELQRLLAILKQR
jgi:preprotein translocase subunit SecD